jgi:energy-coupling factor transporter transmembrane protein EcfT
MTYIPPIVLIIIVFLLAYMLKGWKKYVTIKITHWLLFIYMGILFIAMAITPFISTDFPVRAEGKEDSWLDLFKDLHNGAFNRVNHEYIAQSEVFDYDHPRIKISSNREEDGTHIYVERKNTNDGKIEGFVYNTGFNVNGYQFTDILAPIQLELTDDTLEIKHPAIQNITIAIAKKEFPITQFNGQKRTNVTTMGPDNQAIYLRIPADLEISNKYSNVIYVDK